MQQLLLSLRHCLVGFFFIIWHCRAWANSLGNHAEVPSVSFFAVLFGSFDFISYICQHERNIDIWNYLECTDH